MKRSAPAFLKCWKVILVVLVLPFALRPLRSSRALADAVSPENVLPNEVVVELKPQASIESVDSRNGTTTVARINGTNFFRLHFGTGSVEEWVKKLGADADVIAAYPNPQVSSPFIVNGRRTLAFPSNRPVLGGGFTDYSAQAPLTELELDAVHLRSLGKGAVVAVIDTGVELDHPALAGHMWFDDRAGGEIPNNGIDDDHDGYIDDYYGWNFVDNNNDPSETPGDPDTTEVGHGTFISGLIALMAPEARIMALKAFPPSGVTDAFTVAAAVKYAADHGANVINLSFGGPVVSGVLADAIRDAKSRGVIMAAAVGNNNKKRPQFPASSADVFGVAALDKGDIKAPFSNFGADVAVAAPGVNLISAYPGGQFATWSGTSFATPLAASEAALLLGADEFAPDAVGVIEDTAVPIDGLNPAFTGKLGRGRIDPLTALKVIDFNSGPGRLRQYGARLDLIPAAGISARGIAEIVVSDGGQQLNLVGSGLDPRSEYTLYVNGVPIQSNLALSTSIGSLLLSFSDNPRFGQQELPPTLWPVTLVDTLELKNSAGITVLSGEFLPVSPGSGPANETIYKEANLIPTAPEYPAGGRALIEVTSQRATIRVEAEGVKELTCRLLVDDAFAGKVSTNGRFMKVEFSSDGQEGPMPPANISSIAQIQSVRVLDDSWKKTLLKGVFKN